MDAAGDLAALVGKSTMAAVEQMQLGLGSALSVLLFVSVLLLAFLGTGFAWLARAGKVDARRLLVLRTASNFDMQWPGATAEESLFGKKLSAYIPSLEAAHRVGSVVVHELVRDWARYERELPHGK